MADWAWPRFRLPGAALFSSRVSERPKGPRKNNFPFWGVEALGWLGARREHTGSIRPTSNAARRDASAAENGKFFLPGP